MSDLIRREDVVKAMNEALAVGDITRAIANDILNDVPSAESELKWIPVAEALPEKHQRVLVTIKRIDGEMRVRSGNYFDDYFWIDNGDYWKCNEVLAWMPLPEPWRGE